LELELELELPEFDGLSERGLLLSPLPPQAVMRRAHINRVASESNFIVIQKKSEWRTDQSLWPPAGDKRTSGQFKAWRVNKR